MNFLIPPKYAAKLKAVQLSHLLYQSLALSKVYDEKAIYRHLTIYKRFTTI